MKKMWIGFLGKNGSSGEEGHKERIEVRLNRLYLIVGILFIGLAGVLFFRSAIVPGLSKAADNSKVIGETEQDMKTIVAGDIYDRNLVRLVEHTEVQKSGKYIDGELYFHLLGYIKERSVANDNGEVVENNAGYRLLKYYSDIGTLFETVDIDGRKGCSLVLTLDHNLQTAVEELLIKEMGKETRGSAIVLDAKTGEILVNIAHPSFDANNLSNSLEKMIQSPKEDEVYYPITHKGSVVPGSIFKVVTAIALIDNGMEDFVCLDNDFMIGNTKIKNSYGSTNETIDFHTAIECSSNVYFANAALQLGKDKLDDIAKKFFIGEELELDFGTVKSNWKIEDYSLGQLAQTGFGQGNTELSTIYAAMITQTIANDGMMIRPHLVKEIVNANGKVVQEEKDLVCENVTTKETANKVTNAMLAATKSHLSAVNQEQKNIYQKYEIASKTGTGENGDESDTNNAWLISFAPASDPRYVVVINQCKTDKYGKNLMDTVAEIYKCLFE